MRVPLFFPLVTRPPPRSTPFPTRRSSDLLVLLGEALLRNDEADVPAERFGGAVAEDLLRAAVPRADRDRKSTRLNSSHRCISYAVFCLKKKKSALSATTSALEQMRAPAER